MKVAICRNDVSFSVAFNAARNAGVEEFIWRIGRYHTRTAEEGGDTVPTNKPPVVIAIIEE